MAEKLVKLESFDLAKKCFPEVLFIGNGPCVSCTKASTQDLMKEILKKFRGNNNGLSYNDIQDLPFPMQVVAASADHVSDACEIISGKMIKTNYYGNSGVFQDILSSKADVFLTSNYSYEIEMAANNAFLANTQKFGVYTEGVHRYKKGPNKGKYFRESKNQLHSFYRVPFLGKKRDVWHIHGEARNKSSMVLGHYYYGSLLAECIEENKKYKKRWGDSKDMTLNPLSWLDFFIFGNLYFLGFSLDLNEFDIWWLLNRKKREMRPHGKTYFFVKDLEELTHEHRIMMSANEIEIVCTDAQNYVDHYRKSINMINRGISSEDAITWK